MNERLIFAEGFLTCLTSSTIVAGLVAPSWAALLSPTAVIAALSAVGFATLCGVRRVLVYRQLPTSEPRQ